MLIFNFIVVRKCMLFDFILYLLELNLWLNISAVFMSISYAFKKKHYYFLGVVSYISIKLSRVMLNLVMSSINGEFSVNLFYQLLNWVEIFNSNNECIFPLVLSVCCVHSEAPLLDHTHLG